jgi:hypothetical protein
MTTLTLRDPAFLGGRLLLYPAYVQDYLDRVTAADVAEGNTSGLEMGVTDAASTFLQDLVSISYLGISSAVISQEASVIKAMPIMAGARTLAGALVPVVGLAPTNFNFVAADYNRKTGLKGNGTNKYLHSNRVNNDDPQNSKHLAVYATEEATSAANRFPSYIGLAARSDWSTIFRNQSNGSLQITINSQLNRASTSSAAGFLGASRGASTSFTYRSSGTTQTQTSTSSTPTTGAIYVFTDLSASNYTNARIAFYSIGESLDLALLDARVTALITAIGAAF